MVNKRKRQSSASAKPTTATTTATATITATATSLGPARRVNGRNTTALSSQDTADTLQLDVPQRSHSTDSAESSAGHNIRGRSAPPPSRSDDGRLPQVIIPDMNPQDVSPPSDKTSTPASHSADPTEKGPARSNGHRARSERTKTSSSNSTNSTAENPSIPQI